MNQSVLVKDFDTPGPSESDLVTPKRYLVPPNKSRRDCAFNTCDLPLLGHISSVGILSPSGVVSIVVGIL